LLIHGPTPHHHRRRAQSSEHGVEKSAAPLTNHSHRRRKFVLVVEPAAIADSERSTGLALRLSLQVSPDSSTILSAFGHFAALQGKIGDNYATSWAPGASLKEA